MQMGKKRFRPRSNGGRGTGTGYGGGGGGGGYGGGGGGGGGYGGYQGNGQGNGRVRRRRHYQDRQDRHDRPYSGGPPPFGGEAAPGVEGPPQPALDENGNPLPMPDGGFPLAPAATETLLEPGYGLLEMHPNGYGFLRSPDNTYTRERSDPFVPGTMIEKYGLRPGVMIKGTVQPA